MTVQELINELQKVEDKRQDVKIYSFERYVFSDALGVDAGHKDFIEIEYDDFDGKCNNI